MFMIFIIIPPARSCYFHICVTKADGISCEPLRTGAVGDLIVNLKKGMLVTTYSRYMSVSDPAVSPISAGSCAGVPAVAIVAVQVLGAVPVIRALAPVEMVHFEMVPPHQVSSSHHCQHHQQHHDDPHHDQRQGEHNLANDEQTQKIEL